MNGIATGRRTAIVTDAGLPQGVTVVRSLARAGWRVVAVDSSLLSPAFVSRHADRRRRVVSAESASAESADRIVRLATRERADLVVPITDQALFALLDRAADLPAGSVLASGRRDALEVARRKDETLRLADRVGVPVPRWHLATSVADARHAAGELEWPVVCKPVMSHAPTAAGTVETRFVTFARDDAELTDLLAAGACRLPVVVQEYATGVGIGIDVLCSEGRVLAAFQHRRTREVPLWGGMSSSRVSEPVDPQLLALSRSLLEPLRWTGLAMVEFRSTPTGPVLMEINGRVWGSMALPVRSGMDFPRRLAELHLDGPPPRDEPTDTTYRVGVECRNVELELRWAIQAWKRSDTPIGTSAVPRRDVVGVVAGLLDPRNDFDVQVLDDPLPGVVDAARAMFGPVREAVRRTRDRRASSAA